MKATCDGLNRLLNRWWPPPTSRDGNLAPSTRRVRTKVLETLGRLMTLLALPLGHTVTHPIKGIWITQAVLGLTNAPTSPNGNYVRNWATRPGPILNYKKMSCLPIVLLALRPNKKKWLLNSVVSHNIIGDLVNLSIHYEYDNTDEVIFGDGTSLVVSHISSFALSTLNKNFHLLDAIYLINLHKNLIFVHHFTKKNHIFLDSPILLSCEGSNCKGDSSNRCTWEWCLHVFQLNGGLLSNHSC